MQTFNQYANLRLLVDRFPFVNEANEEKTETPPPITSQQVIKGRMDPLTSLLKIDPAKVVILFNGVNTAD